MKRLFVGLAVLAAAALGGLAATTLTRSSNTRPVQVIELTQRERPAGTTRRAPPEAPPRRAESTAGPRSGSAPNSGAPTTPRVQLPRLRADGDDADDETGDDGDDAGVGDD